MSWYGSPSAEAAALRRACARAGCRVQSLGVVETADGPHAMGQIDCPDGWHAAKLLVASALEDAGTPGARRAAAAIRARTGSPEDYARAVQEHVRRNVRFQHEAGEVFTNSGYTLASGVGDCDDHARAAMALALAGGLPARLAFLHAGKGPTHAVAQLCPSGACSWAETTVPAYFGEAPLAAAERLGILQSRRDLSQGVRVMTENDLAPLPSGFAARQSAAQVFLDSSALMRLGYFTGPPTSDATDMSFRKAVLAFQIAVGLTADGLVGPKTRAAIAARLPTGQESEDYHRSIGAIGAAPSALTSHLSPDFFRGVWQMAQDFAARGAALKPEAFLAVWKRESDVKPWAKNSLGFAGLNQLGTRERAAVGAPLDVDAYTSLSAENQLPFVRRYYESNVRDFARGDYGVLADAGSLYLLNFLPAFIGQSRNPSFVLAAADNDPHAWYRDNRGLDIGQKGYIEVADMARATDAVQSGAYWDELVSRLYAEGGGGASSSSGPPVAALAILAASLAGAAAYVWRALT